MPLLASSDSTNQTETNPTGTSFSETDLAEWLIQSVPGYEFCELVTDHLWAKTYRVHAASGTYFAKWLPGVQRSTLGAMESISNAFGSRVPQVLRVSEEKGILLQHDHGGKPLRMTDNQDRSDDLLRMYGQMQVEATRHAEVLARLPKMNLNGMIERFVEFFTTDSRASHPVGAAHFLGERKASYYRDRLSMRIQLLKPLIEAAAELPHTINHCDLRPQNAAERDDGSLVIFDWDDSILGPAGLSLHNFFSGCAWPVSILCKGPLSQDNAEKYRALLDVYVETLVEGGYASREKLRNGLAGSIVVGVMRYLMSYGNFPMDDEDDRKTIAKIIRRRTDDLLVACDELIMNDRTTVLAHVRDYQQGKNADAASTLAQRFLRRQELDLEMQSHLASSLFMAGKIEQSEEICRRSIEHDPTQPNMRFLLGHIHLENLDLDAAIDQWKLARQFHFEDPQLDQWIVEIQQIRDAVSRADDPGVVPSIKLTATEDEYGTFARLRSRVAAGLFREFGTLLVEDAFSPELLNSLHEEFLTRYWPQLKGGDPENALQVGNKRFMVTLDVAGPFNHSDLYASPFLMSVFRRLMGDDYVLGSFTAVTALPGAAEMRMHKDHPALFHSSEIDHPLPTFAITVLVPLLGLNAEMGTTRVVKRSQRKSSDESETMDFQDPLGPQGSCLLMDYRLSHQGLANRSQRVRPVLSMVYNRSWFRDKANYKKQSPLEMSRTEFDQVADENRFLFDWHFPGV